MRRLWLIVISGLAFAPAYAAIDPPALGIFADDGDAVRLQIVQGMADASPGPTAQNNIEIRN